MSIKEEETRDDTQARQRRLYDVLKAPDKVSHHKKNPGAWIPQAVPPTSRRTGSRSSDW